MRSDHPKLRGRLDLQSVHERPARQAIPEVGRCFTLAPELVIVAGFDGHWKRVNPTVEAVLGYTERERLARAFMEFIHPDVEIDLVAAEAWCLTDERRDSNPKPPGPQPRAPRRHV
jgi:PAS domain-containing protein